jgi:hypothetical protein
MVLRRHGGVLLLRPLVDFYSGVDNIITARRMISGDVLK